MAWGDPVEPINKILKDTGKKLLELVPEIYNEPTVKVDIKPGSFDVMPKTVFQDGHQWGEPKQFNSHSQLLIFEHDGKKLQRACIVVGSLAIHDDLVDPNCFQISHIPTRTSFMGAVPAADGIEYNHEQLVTWCKAVQSKHLEHWEKLNLLTPENYRSELKHVVDDLRQLQEWCLSWAI